MAEKLFATFRSLLALLALGILHDALLLGGLGKVLADNVVRHRFPNLPGRFRFGRKRFRDRLGEREQRLHVHEERLLSHIRGGARVLGLLIVDLTTPTTVQRTKYIRIIRLRVVGGASWVVLNNLALDRKLCSSKVGLSSK